MGKGSRNKELKAAQRQAEKDRIAKKKANVKKRAKIGGFAAAIGAAAVALVLVVVFIFNAVVDSGASLRGASVLKTESTNVDAAMASYYMYTLFSNFKTNNSSYIDSMMDLGKSLKNQECYYDKEVSWYEYFAGLTAEQIVSYVALADMAAAEGMTLTEQNQKLIDESIEAIDSYAKNSKMSVAEYIRKNYGRGVKKNDIRRALELYYLASQKYQDIYDSKDVTFEEISEYAESNKESYYTASYYEFTIEADYDLDVADQETINNSVKIAKLKAQELAACKTAKEFESFIKNYCLTELEQEEDAAEKSVTSAKHTDVSYRESSEMQKWEFSADRKAGDTRVFEGTEKFTVVYIIEPSHKNETESRNFKHILLSLDKFETTAHAKEKADEILNQLSANLTAEAFDKAAEEFSEDTVVDYKNIVKGSLDDKVDNWLYAEDRQVGDIEIIENGKLVHIVYYTGEGLETWQQNALDAIKKKYCDSSTAETEEELTKKVAIKALENITI